jgi:2-keto-4-pentenoate hydratase
MSRDHERAAELIWRHWQAGAVMDALPPGLAPATRADGYAIQACLERYSAQPRAGWKIAGTNVAGQRHIGVDSPLAGRLLAERLVWAGAGEVARLSLEGNAMRVAEPEFAFRFGHELPPREAPRTLPEVMAAVAELHLAIEMPDSRLAEYASAGAPALIADNACARDLVVGPPVAAGWRETDLAAQRVHAHVVQAGVGDRYERDGSGANVLGDPRIALAWLVNEVSSLGITIAPGEFVTTGVVTVPLEVRPGDRIEADFGSLGAIRVEVTGCSDEF